MSQHKNAPKTPYYKKPLVLLIIGTVILVLGVGGYYLTSRLDNSNQPSNPADIPPATETEKAEAETNKKKLEQRTELEQTPPTEPTFKNVKPVISYAGQNSDFSLEVTGFIPSIYEDGGSCTLNLKKATVTITKTSAAHKDVSYTSCTTLVVPYTELTAGNWEATLSYTSANASGTSDTQTVTIK